MHHFTIFVFIITIIALCHAKSLPSNLKRCSKSSPEFSKCLKAAVSEGIASFDNGSPELGIPRLEPFLVKSLDLGQTSTGSVSLHQVYNNLNLYGMTKGDILNFEAEFSKDKCYWSFNGLTKVLTMVSDYTLTGQLLVFPINGHGMCNNSLFDMDVKHEMKCELYTKKEKTHVRILDYSMEINPKSITYFFDNIIDGNPQLSREVLKTLNENALTVFADIRKGFANAFSQIWKNVGNSVFSKIPEDQIFLP